MTRFVWWSSDCSIGIESDCIILAINLGLPLLLINLEDLIEPDDSLVIAIEFGDQFA
jgi:hypothetical protein